MARQKCGQPAPEDVPKPKIKSATKASISSVIRLSEGNPVENLNSWNESRVDDVQVANHSENYFLSTYRAIEAKIKKEEFNDTDSLRSELWAILRNDKSNNVFENCLNRLLGRSKYYLIFYDGEKNQMPFLIKTMLHLAV